MCSVTSALARHASVAGGCAVSAAVCPEG